MSKPSTSGKRTTDQLMRRRWYQASLPNGKTFARQKGGRGRQQRVEPGEGVGETLRSPAGVGTLGDDAVGALPHREVAPPVRLVRLPEEEEHAGRDGAGDEAAGHLAAPRA